MFDDAAASSRLLKLREEKEYDPNEPKFKSVESQAGKLVELDLTNTCRVLMVYRFFIGFNRFVKI